MPQILGTDFIRSLKNPPKVIFTTAYRKFAVEGFELNAVDYLLKPISFEPFLKAVSKVMNITLPVSDNINSPLENKKTLPRDNFIRIHRSFIVALNKIESYNSELIGIAKKELPISRMYSHEVEGH